MHHYRLGIGTALIAVAAVAGCRSTDSTPTPPPSRVSATTSASSTLSPTPSAGAISAADAEKIYRTIVANKVALYKKGGLIPGEPTPASLSDYASGQALKDYMTYMHQVSGMGITWKTGTSKITAVHEKTGDTAYPEAAIALESCEDYSSIRTVDRHGKTDHGRIFHVDSWYARNKAGTIKMIAFNSMEVSSCDVK
ncbi:hypothetical protein HMPREF9622_00049 [Cutibacterium modestum HL037PA3]|uniref:hypothetical protein n=1 Tax=Cutibacterium modestum TaxID=2559073 RepID=UPI0001F0923D|nr:hypothetical protein [Cutibacterium modestum]EFT16870.1 hypothetical protein HMPREF9622_00049 [Cutibacterium modestum HL037PA3]